MHLRLPHPKTSLPGRIEGLLSTARKRAFPPAPERFPALRKAEDYLARQAGQDFPKRRLRIPNSSLVPLIRGSAVAPVAARFTFPGARFFVANDNRSRPKSRRFVPRFNFWSLLVLTFLVAMASAYFSGRSQAEQRVHVVPDASWHGSEIA